MEGRKSRKFLNKIFHSNNKKQASISPHEGEWTPGYTTNQDPISTNSYPLYSSTGRPSEGPSITRSSPIQRRYSYSNTHENGQIRLLQAKRSEYNAKMNAFTDLIQQRRGSTLRSTLAPDVASH